MVHVIGPALFALFVWWFSTGVVILLDNLPPRTFRASMAGATVLLAAAAWGLARSGTDASPAGAYTAFVCAMLAWAWQELAFYTGTLTGPRRIACAPGCRGAAHFGHAIEASLWHELAMLAGLLGIVALTWGRPNQFGTWTFVVMWWMHQSARLNVFLGVPNVAEELLPPHLGFLKGFLARRPMNWLFPVSVTVSTVVCLRLVDAALARGASPFTRAGFSFLAAMMALAILEHWFLVLPLPVARLWGWSLRARSVTATIVPDHPDAGWKAAASALPACLDLTLQPIER